MRSAKNEHSLKYLQQTIQNNTEQGKPLSDTIRTRMECLFGYDFSGVRIHEESEAKMIGARAFACGADIYFDEGLYDPDSEQGLMLLTHELAHVVQQQTGRANLPDIDRLSILKSKTLEDEADSMALLAICLRNYEPTGSDLERTSDGYDLCKTNLKKHGTISRNTPSKIIQCAVYDNKQICKSLLSIKDAIKKKFDIRSLKFNLDSPVTNIFFQTLIAADRKYTIEQIAGFTPKMMMELDEVQKAVARNWVKTFRVKKSLEKRINLDQIKDEDFTAFRRERIANENGMLGLARIYGLRVAKNLNEKQRGLRILHAAANKYWRDAFKLGKFGELQYEIFKARYQNERFDSSKELWPVNSEHVKTKLISLFPEAVRSLSENSTKIKSLKIDSVYDGIYCMPVEKNAVLKYVEAGENAGTIQSTPLLDTDKIENIGAIPSLYQTLKFAESRRPPIETETGNPPDSNRGRLLAILKEITGLAEFGVGRHLSNDAHPLKNIHSVAYHLLIGLDALYQKSSKQKELKQKFEKNPAVYDALANLKNIADSLSVSQNTMAVSSRLYGLLMDELMIILDVVNPFKKEDFEQRVKTIYLKRIPAFGEKPLKGKLDIDVYIESSGMGAISSALAIAFLCHEKNSKVGQIYEERDYFEFKGILKKFCRTTFPIEKANILYATLNPSTPSGKNPDIVKRTIDAIEKKLETGSSTIDFATLIIDITIEIDEGDSSQLNSLIRGLNKFLITKKLMIILAKSYQKYGSLGSAKIMTGMLMTIQGKKNLSGFAKAQSFIKELKGARGYQKLIENKLMTYYLQNGEEFEIKLLQQGTQNARIINSFWTSKNEIRKKYDRNLPFIIRQRPNKKPFSTEGVEPERSEHIIQKFGIEFRDSFSFMNSSYLKVTDPESGVPYYRFTIGQEPAGLLHERFYAIGKYFELSFETQVKVDRILKDFAALNSGAPKYKFNKMTSLLLYAFYLYYPADVNQKKLKSAEKKELQKLEKPFDDYFAMKDSLIKSSPESAEELVLIWLRLKLKIKKKPVANQNVIDSMQKYIHYVAPHRLANLFKDEIENSLIAKAGTDARGNLIDLFFKRLDLESKFEICRLLILNGEETDEKSKLQALLEHIWLNDLTRWRIEGDHVKEIQKRLSDKANLNPVKNKAFDSREKFVEEIKKIAEIKKGKENEIIENAKSGSKFIIKEKEEDYYIKRLKSKKNIEALIYLDDEDDELKRIKEFSSATAFLQALKNIVVVKDGKESEILHLAKKRIKKAIKVRAGLLTEELAESVADSTRKNLFQIALSMGEFAEEAYLKGVRRKDRKEAKARKRKEIKDQFAKLKFHRIREHNARLSLQDI